MMKTTSLRSRNTEAAPVDLQTTQKPDFDLELHSNSRCHPLGICFLMYVFQLVLNVHKTI
jgi:hypothetical protein